MTVSSSRRFEEEEKVEQIPKVVYITIPFRGYKVIDSPLGRLDTLRGGKASTSCCQFLSFTDPHHASLSRSFWWFGP